MKTLPEQMLRIDFTEAVAALVDKIEQASIRLGDVAHVNYAAQMSSRKKGGFGKEHVLRNRKESETCRKTVSGRDLYRYKAQWAGKYVEWALAPEMYGPRAEWFFERPKLMIRDITGTHRIEAALDRTALYCDHTILCALRFADVPGSEKVAPEKIELSKLYPLELLQAVVASRLVSAYFYWALTGEGVRTGGGFHTYPTTVRALPLPSPALLRRAARDGRVGELEELAKRLARAAGEGARETSPAKSDQLRRQFEANDARLDDIIYKTYELTKEEIALVVKATS